MFFIILFFSILSIEAQASDDGSLVEQYIALAVQGDLRPAKTLFEKAELRTLSTTDSQFITQFRKRFVDQSDTAPPESGSALIDGVILSFQHYWIDSLMGTQEQQINELKLEDNLKILISRHGNTEGIQSDSDVHKKLGALLASEGVYYLDDIAPPWRDLFLWRKQEVRNYPVTLTDHTRTVRVIFMEDFQSLGWKYYASLGLASTTGWVENGELYCVDWAYDRNSERFKVSYLKHEARHLADYERFPGLDAVELEYRAKLTELAFAHHSATRLLEDFISKSAENPESPHAMANFQVTRDLKLELYSNSDVPAEDSWHRISVSRLNLAARNLLILNTNALLAAE